MEEVFDYTGWWLAHFDSCFLDIYQVLVRLQEVTTTVLIAVWAVRSTPGTGGIWHRKEKKISSYHLDTVLTYWMRAVWKVAASEEKYILRR